MDEHLTKQQAREVASNRAAGLQYLMIVLVFAAALIVLAVWRPWTEKNIHGLPTEVAPTPTVAAHR